LTGNLVRLTLLRMEDITTILRWRENTRFLRLWGSNPIAERAVRQSLSIAGV